MTNGVHGLPYQPIHPDTHPPVPANLQVLSAPAGPTPRDQVELGSVSRDVSQPRGALSAMASVTADPSLPPSDTPAAASVPAAPSTTGSCPAQAPASPSTIAVAPTCLPSIESPPGSHEPDPGLQEEALRLFDWEMSPGWSSRFDAPSHPFADSLERLAQEQPRRARDMVAFILTDPGSHQRPAVVNHLAEACEQAATRPVLGMLMAPLVDQVLQFASADAPGALPPADAAALDRRLSLLRGLAHLAPGRIDGAFLQREVLPLMRRGAEIGTLSTRISQQIFFESLWERCPQAVAPSASLILEAQSQGIQCDPQLLANAASQHGWVPQDETQGTRLAAWLLPPRHASSVLDYSERATALATVVKHWVQRNPMAARSFALPDASGRPRPLPEALLDHVLAAPEPTASFQDFSPRLQALGVLLAPGQEERLLTDVEAALQREGAVSRLAPGDRNRLLVVCGLPLAGPLKQRFDGILDRIAATPQGDPVPPFLDRTLTQALKDRVTVSPGAAPAEVLSAAVRGVEFAACLQKTSARTWSLELGHFLAALAVDWAYPAVPWPLQEKSSALRSLAEESLQASTADLRGRAALQVLHALSSHDPEARALVPWNQPVDAATRSRLLAVATCIYGVGPPSAARAEALSSILERGQVVIEGLDLDRCASLADSLGVDDCEEKAIGASARQFAHLQEACGGGTSAFDEATRAWPTLARSARPEEALDHFRCLRQVYSQDAGLAAAIEDWPRLEARLAAGDTLTEALNAVAYDRLVQSSPGQRPTVSTGIETGGSTVVINGIPIPIRRQDP